MLKRLSVLLLAVMFSATVYASDIGMESIINRVWNGSDSLRGTISGNATLEALSCDTLVVSDDVIIGANGKDGRVGIGIAVPTVSLDVNGTIRSNTRSGGTLILGDADGVNYTSSFIQNTGVSYLTFGSSTTNFWINNTNRDINYSFSTLGNVNTVFIDGGTNRVGIGTSTPAVSLDVAGQVSADALVLRKHAASPDVTANTPLYYWDNVSGVPAVYTGTQYRAIQLN